MMDSVNARLQSTSAFVYALLSCAAEQHQGLGATAHHYVLNHHVLPQACRVLYCIFAPVPAGGPTLTVTSSQTPWIS